MRFLELTILHQCIAPAFGKAGVRGIVLTATNLENLRATEENLNRQYPPVQTLVVSADTTDEAAVANLFEQVKSRFGHADILVNNAGVSSGGGSLDQENSNAWWRNFVSVSALAFCFTLLTNPNRKST